jgi:hypothetical protein
VVFVRAARSPVVTAVTTLDGRIGLIGARGTRYFKKHVEGRDDAREFVQRALDRMPYVRSRWPNWPSAPPRKTTTQNE